MFWLLIIHQNKKHFNISQKSSPELTISKKNDNMLILETDDKKFAYQYCLIYYRPFFSCSVHSWSEL